MATLISVNVGLPKDVTWRGRTVHTGAWKAPVHGPRMIRHLNVDGDGQGDLGGHGGENRAVLVYQLESYRHWRDALGIDLKPGDLGENLTVDGLSDDEVCVGDRYRVGTAVVEVTQPRVTCYRVGLRVGEPRMAALLVSHGRPGFYCRVLQEGQVEAGQEIVKVGDGPERVSVAELDALLYLPGHPRAALRRALRIPALSPGWRASLQSLLDDHGTGDETPMGNPGLTGVWGEPPAWPGFRSLRVTRIRDESRHVRSLTLSSADGTPLPTWTPGQAIALRMVGRDGLSTMVRNYSLSNAPDSGEYRIGVKRESQGTVSAMIHERVEEGDDLDVAAPRGSFVLDDRPSPIVLLSAGVGVTPMLSMLHALCSSRSGQPIWWLHGARDGTEHPFAAEARRVLELLPDSLSRVYYSRPTAADCMGVDYDQRGRLSPAAIRDLELPGDAHAFLCGPTPFMDEMSRALVDCGLSPAAVATEAFGANAALNPGIVGAVPTPPHLPQRPPGPGPDIHFSRSALTAPWDPDYGSLLDFAEACDVPTRWSCRTGVCHNCETALLAGRVRYDVEPLDPPARGNVLLCVSAPTEGLVLDL